MLHPFLGVYPRIDPSVFVAPSADIIGDVVLGPDCSVWFNTTIRGDVNWIRIGARSNVQDGAVIHVTNRTSPTRIGSDVTIGHSAVVHGCTIGNHVLVGIGAVILDHAEIGEECLIGARALITGGVKIPPRSMVLGSPAKVVRSLTNEEVVKVRSYASNYVKYARMYRGVETPESNPYYDREGAPGE